MNSKTFTFWAKEIKHLYGEDEKLYYEPYDSKNKTLQHGKLYHKFTNTKKFIKTKESPMQRLTEDNNETLSQLLQMLPADPKLKSVWEQTFLNRQKFGDLTILQYYEKFIFLKDEVGIDLVI